MYGAYGSGAFEGKYNTKVINFVQEGTSTAAMICGNLMLAEYDDWYLPSIHELNLMYLNIGQGNSLGLGNIGVFSNSFYWSSTEFNNNFAWAQYFNDGRWTAPVKDRPSSVRAVRAF